MGCYGTRMRSCGVHRRGSGGTFALGRPVFAAMRLRYGGWDCCEPKRKKLRGGHEGIRIGPLTGHMGRGRTSMTNTRRAKARRCFRKRRFRYVTRAAGRGQRCRNGGNLGGNRQSEGTKAKPQKPNDSNGFRGSNPGGGYEIRTREAVTPTRFPSVRHRPLGESSMLCSAQLNCVPQATRISYHRFRISARFGVARVATRMRRMITASERLTGKSRATPAQGPHTCAGPTHPRAPTQPPVKKSPCPGEFFDVRPARARNRA